MPKPNLFVVGNPKSGTTSLHGYLGQHPEIFMSFFKEPYFFCEDINNERKAYSTRKKPNTYETEHEYLKLFKKAGNKKVIGETSPMYLYSKTAARNIRKFNPHAKIIMIFREPVSFLRASYTHRYAMRTETAETFEEALELEPQRKAGKNIPSLVYFPSSTFYSERIRYAEQARRYFDQFPTERIKVLIYEDYKQDNKKTYRSILEFLNVDPDFVPDFSKTNVGSKPRLKSFNNWLFNSTLKSAFQHLCPAGAYDRFVKPAGKKILWKTQQRQPLDPQLRQKLMKRFKPEVEKISELLQMDLLTKWGYTNL